MIQVTGLTKTYRRGRSPALLDLTFDARPGTVTVLLGDRGAGKSTALRLMVELERGHGVTLFDGRTYRRLRHPERHVGVMMPPSGRSWPRPPGPGPADPAVPGTAAPSDPGPSRPAPSAPAPSHPSEPRPIGHRPGRSDDVSGAAPLLRGGCLGHPGRRAADHLRMLAAAVGVPSGRADELLEQTRLAAVADHRLRTFSPGMHRRLALAAALLGDPAVLLLDAPTDGMSARATEWFHGFLRSFAVAGGNVVVTTRSTGEAAILADRVVTLEAGRPVADQSAEDFRRTRLFPEVVVRGPQMARLADALREVGAEVRPTGGTVLAVSGIDRTEIGELAYRHGILLHELADRVVEQPVPRPVLPVGSGRSGQVHPSPGSGGPADRPAAGGSAPCSAEGDASTADRPEEHRAAEDRPDGSPPIRTGAGAVPRGPRHRGALPTVPSLLGGPRPPLPSDPYADANPDARADADIDAGPDRSRAAGVHPQAATPRTQRSQ